MQITNQEIKTQKPVFKFPQYMESLIKDRFIYKHNKRGEFGDYYINLDALALHFDIKGIQKAKFVLYPEENAFLIELVTTELHRLNGGNQDVWSHVYEIPKDVTGFKDCLYITYLKEFPSVYEKDYKPTSNLNIIEKH